MARNFTGFLGDHNVSLGWPARIEKFNFTLRPGRNLRGSTVWKWAPAAGAGHRLQVQCGEDHSRSR